MAKKEPWRIDPIGEKACRFINQLYLSGDYVGSKYNLRFWQEVAIRRLFGTRDRQGNRQFKRFLYGLPRGCGKTQLAAAIALYLMLGQGKQGQCIYSASGDRNQAALIFQLASASIMQDPVLSSRVTIYETTKRLLDKKTGNTYQALASDAKLRYGLAPSACIYDEGSFWGDNEDLHTALHTSFLKRIDPLEIYISSAGFDRECWFYRKIWQYAEQILDGTIKDNSFLPIIYAAKPGLEPLDVKTWKTCIPSLGDFTSLEVLQREAALCKLLPSHLPYFETLYLNRWQSGGNERWIPLDKWDACCLEGLEAEEGSPCFAGLDLASVKDLAALSLVFPVDQGYLLQTYAWIPEDGATHRSNVDNVPYVEWARQGFLKATEGEAIDFGVIKADILELSRRYNIQSLAIDPWNAHMLGQELGKEGVHVEFYRQGFASLNCPSKHLEQLILEKSIRHDGNPVARWCIGNCATATDENGNIKPSKKRSADKIDIVMSLVMALGVAMSGEINSGEPEIIWV